MKNINQINGETFHPTRRTFLLSTAIFFNLTSCKPDYHSSTNISPNNTEIQPNIIPDNTEIQPNTEQETPKGDYYCEIINDISKLIKEEDGKKYIDDKYHYPIIEKDGKPYLLYNNTEYELENCQIINDNNYKFYIYSLKNGGDICYLADGEIQNSGDITSDMGITTDKKNYFKITNSKTQKETFVINGKEIGKLDYILKVYLNGSTFMVIGYDKNKEGNPMWKLITGKLEDNAYNLYYSCNPYEVITGIGGKLVDEKTSLEFYSFLSGLKK